MARVGVIGTVLVLLYSFAPLGRRLDGSVLTELIISLVVLAVVAVWEFRTVARATFPEIRAIEAVAVMLPLLLLPFSTAYYVMSHEVFQSFGVRLSRIDALYFTVTTFATVGFGDITAKTEPARVVVMVQMVVDLILIGLLAKALLGTARRRRDTLSSSAPQR